MEEVLICGEEKSVGIPKEIIQAGGYKVPDCYLKAKQLVEIGKALREKNNTKCITLPLCQTVEVEFLGGQVNYANDELGPRVSNRIFSSLEELPIDKSVNFSIGLCEEVRLAAEELKQNQEDVILNVSGPMTVLSGLVEMQKIFVQRRKNPQIYEKAIQWIVENLFSYIELMKGKISLVSLADPAAGLDLMGAKVAKELAELAYIPLLKRIQTLGVSVHLCPRMTAVLLLSEHVHKKEQEISISGTYEEVVLDLARNKGKIIAHGCLKQKQTQYLEGKLQVLELD